MGSKRRKAKKFSPNKEEIKEEPKIEEIKEEPKIEEIKEEPKIEEIKEEPKIEIKQMKKESKEGIKMEIQEIEKEIDEDDISEDEVKETEKINKKCSLDEHKDLDAEYYCQECKVSMCKKCEKVHSGFLKNHHAFTLNKDIKEIFTGLCTKPNHALKLEYYCKTHNQLCCAACIAKIKNKWNGQHKDCDIYFIVKIKNSIKGNFDKNMKKLEEFSNKIEPTIKELKDIYEKINESKDKLKGEIQNIFTKIRTELNNREDKLYEEIETKYNELYFKEELIKESEKLPNSLKISLEKGKIKENDWEDENILPKLINDSINIENIIKNINDIYGKINDFISKKYLSIKFNLTNEEIAKGLLNEIKSFGRIEIIENNEYEKKEF